MDTLRIPLAGSVGVAQVEQLHATVKNSVESQEPIALDFSEVRDIDASILQLMLAMQKASRDSAAQAEFTGFSDAFAEMLRSNGAEKLMAGEGEAEEAESNASANPTDEANDDQVEAESATNENESTAEAVQAEGASDQE